MKKGMSMKLVFLGLAVTFTFALAPAAIAQPGEFVKGILQPLADGFPKRALTLVVVDDAGTRDDIYAKTLQESLRSISPVSIAVSDEPLAQGGSFHKLQDISNREGGNDGYYPEIVTVWGIATDPLTEPIKKELGMDIEDLNMVITTEGIPYLMIQRKGAPWGPTFAGMVKYAKANPGKLKYISSGVGSGVDISCSTVLLKAGILDKIVRIPAKGLPQAAQIVGAGEGDFAFTWAELALIHTQAGKVDVTLSTRYSIPPPWDKDPNVVTLEGAGLGKTQLGNFMGIVVPRKVSKAHVDWLYKLFKAAASTDLHKKREQQIPGLKIEILNPQESNELVKKLKDMADPVVRQIGLHVDQQK